MKVIKAALFPAFGAKFLGMEQSLIEDAGIDFGNALASARIITGVNLSDNNLSISVSEADELHSQLLTYLYSCTLSDLLDKKNISPDFIAGYSMGLYAALYHAGSITLEQGLEMVATAYNLIHARAMETDFAMGVIVGLDHGDVDDLIRGYHGDVEISNINNEKSFMISGLAPYVQEILNNARDEGALSTKNLFFNSPYHSKFMDMAARDFEKYLRDQNIRDPRCPIISTVHRHELTTSDEIINELSNNINCPINWLQTMNFMLKSGVTVFIECGPGKSLDKIARFIPGNFKVYPVNRWGLLFSDKDIMTQVAISSK